MDLNGTSDCAPTNQKRPILLSLNKNMTEMKINYMVIHYNICLGWKLRGKGGGGLRVISRQILTRERE